MIAFVVLIALGFIVKKADMYSARCFVLWVFTSLFYKHNLYTVFAFILFGCVVISSNYTKVKRNVIIKGIVLGVIAVGVAYYLAGFVPGY